jgi:hypothetical protein
LLADVDPVEDGADVVGQGVFGGDDLVPGLDVDGVVAAQRRDQLLGGSPSLSLEPSGDGEGGEHHGEVGLDGVALDRPGPKITFGHGSSSRSATAGG